MILCSRGRSRTLVGFALSSFFPLIALRNVHRQTQATMGFTIPPTTTGAKKLTTLNSHTSITPIPTHRQPYHPSGLKGLFAGSGRAALSTPYFAQAVIDLTNLPRDQVNVLYIGTAMYDIPKYQQEQTSAFIELGCIINSLDVANSSLSILQMQQKVDTANVLLVSGGNTLYALDRWKAVGLDLILKEAVQNGNKVMAGGSAGAICWFDGGHSDSMDPGEIEMFFICKELLLFLRNTLFQTFLETYRTAKIGANQQEANQSTNTFHYNPAISPKLWSYIRVSGLSILPGLICPHYDCIQSNGISRSSDFESMLLRHDRELGLGIDHYAALVLDGEEFRVLSLPDAPQGSIPYDGNLLKPGVWIKYIEEGVVRSKVCPSYGKVEELLQVMSNPESDVWEDKRVELCRNENPCPCYK